MEVVQSNLSNLGYDYAVYEKDFGEGTPNLIFADVITWLCSQLASFCKLESYVNLVSSNDVDRLGFSIEVSSLLKELCCPYKNLVKGQIAERLHSAEEKKLIVLYLCTELESAKIQAFEKSRKKEVSMKIELSESKIAGELKRMLISLSFPKPPETITPQILFGEVEKQLKRLSHPSTPREKVGELLFSGVLMEKQWFHLENLYREMYQEYKTRRNLLLTRCDVTVKSFLWADRLKTEGIMNIYNNMKSGITSKPSVKQSHVLSAKSDLAVIEKTSSASVCKNTKSSVNSVVMEDVPDRGGRPWEYQPPPLEVPKWQTNDSSRGRGARQSNPQNTGSFYSRRNTDYSRYSDSYRDNTGNAGKNTGYSSENVRCSRNNYGYSRNITVGYSRDESSNLRSATSKENISLRNSYKGSYNRSYYNPKITYQPDVYCPQLSNLQFGIGGFMPAGDNFQHYGMSEDMSHQIHNLKYRDKGNSRGLKCRGRRGYDRSFDQL